LIPDYHKGKADLVFTHDTWSRALAVAATLHWERPAEALAENPVKTTLIDESSMVSAMLVKLINGPDPKLIDDIPHASPLAREVGFCVFVENGFATTLGALEQPQATIRLASNVPVGWTIVERDGSPVGIIKTRGEKTMLTLDTITAEGISLPPGSLVAADIPVQYRNYDHSKHSFWSSEIANTPVEYDDERFRLSTIRQVAAAALQYSQPFDLNESEVA
jgi:hypothetical protein